MTASSPATVPGAETVRPPVWLMVVTGLLAVGTLGMAVAETNLWMHYLIDAGESISLAGLLFILLAGASLFRRGRLSVSLPLALPWLLFPVITQGDQIIDNLSINGMRLMTHVLLAALFAAPVAIIVSAVRFAVAGPAGPSRLAAIPGLRQLASGRSCQVSAVLAAVLLAAEMWVAVRFLGKLMVITLLIMLAAVLIYGFVGATHEATPTRRGRGERFALGLLIAGVVTSAGLYFGYKNRPGAYQGSPSYFMDPSQEEARFQFDQVRVPSRPPAPPNKPEGLHSALTTYGDAFVRLLDGYYILDRNYNYDFHNRLFLRRTPLLPEYRAVGLRTVDDAKRRRAAADQTLAASDPPPIADALGAFLEDVRRYAAFTFDRAPLLERMSAEFEATEAGLQHATHLYEGEGKVLGADLEALLDKHAVVLSVPAVRPLTGEFVVNAHEVRQAYANRIVGF